MPETKQVSVAIVKHVDSISVYLEDDVIIELKKESIDNGPGMQEAKLTEAEFIRTLDAGLWKLGYVVVKLEE